MFGMGFIVGDGCGWVMIWENTNRCILSTVQDGNEYKWLWVVDFGGCGDDAFFKC